MKRSNRKRHRPEEVVARLKRAHPRVSRDNAHLDSSPETSASHALRAVQISPEATRLLMRSWIPASETVSQRQTGRAVCRCAQSESNETMREHAREGRPETWPRHSAGPPKLKQGRPPRAQPMLSSLGRKPPYARRKTRTRDFSLGP